MAKQGKVRKLGREFSQFLVRGNAIVLATGVVIGGAFQAVVNSLVNDILMPIIGALTAGVDFSEASIAIGETIEITYGALITAVLNLLIIGVVIFFLVKSIQSADEAMKKLCCRNEEAVPQMKFKCSEIISHYETGAGESL